MTGDIKKDPRQTEARRESGKICCKFFELGQPGTSPAKEKHDHSAERKESVGGWFWDRRDNVRRRIPKAYIVDTSLESVAIYRKANSIE